jgi:malate dehydrogenase (quinone)
MLSLIGGGIMSATLGSMLRELDPHMSIDIYEKLESVAFESSSAWNNAGTGHAAFCELNYTPQRKDGSIDVRKALEISESFEISKQFWAYKFSKNKDLLPSSFINNVPHVSFVWGEHDVDFLKKRYETLIQNPLFASMKYSQDYDELKNWMPLVLEGRDKNQKIAGTKMDSGTDVDFGALTRILIDDLIKTPKANLYVQHEIIAITKYDEHWLVKIKDLANNTVKNIEAKFVFIGAGGKALTLLQKSGIQEAKGFGGFPVGGQWLVTTNPALVNQHSAKVYGQAPIGAPPMSVPHLDTRYIKGQKALLFGPFATFSTKFLKEGSWFDLFGSITFSNIIPMIQAGFKNISLTKYLIEQVLLSKEQRIKALQEYMPNAKIEDWDLQNAGQRVQIIKNDPQKGGILQFGTELVSSSDGKLVALLGASPGASVTVKIMLDLLEVSFKKELQTTLWQEKIKEMIPSYGQKLSENIELLKKVRERNTQFLKLL